MKAPNRPPPTVASLSRKLRDRINGLMRDGASRDAIVRTLKLRDYGLDWESLKAWSEGGYRDWRREQERLHSMRAARSFAIKLAKANPDSRIQEGAFHLVASHIYEFVSHFDVQAVKGQFKADPKTYALWVGLLAKISVTAMHLERQRAEAKTAPSPANTAPCEAGLTPETLNAIEAQLKLM